MACVQRQEKTEGIAERVLGMKNEKEKIDLLLERNAADQLAKIDWQGLNAAVSDRLDQTRQSKTPAIRFTTGFRMAAGVAAAAVIVVAVMIKTQKPADLKLENGLSAMVTFVETKGSASVEIMPALAGSQALVDVGARRRELAKCHVEIIDVNGDLKEKADRAAWIIISRPEPVYADNGVSTDLMDVMYLF